MASASRDRRSVALIAGITAGRGAKRIGRRRAFVRLERDEVVFRAGSQAVAGFPYSAAGRRRRRRLSFVRLERGVPRRVHRRRGRTRR